MSALTPAQRAKRYRLRKRTEKTVIAAAERCERAMLWAAECVELGWLATAKAARHGAELASIQAFAAVAHMQKQLESK